MNGVTARESGLRCRKLGSQHLGLARHRSTPSRKSLPSRVGGIRNSRRRSIAISFPPQQPARLSASAMDRGLSLAAASQVTTVVFNPAKRDASDGKGSVPGLVFVGRG